MIHYGVPSQQPLEASCEVTVTQYARNFPLSKFSVALMRMRRLTGRGFMLAVRIEVTAAVIDL